jgi:hypothetical protein
MGFLLLPNSISPINSANLSGLPCGVWKLLHREPISLGLNEQQNRSTEALEHCDTAAEFKGRNSGFL